MKQAESLSLQTIIVAAIVLVVFIVVILIFTKGIKPAQTLDKINQCQSDGGTCQASCSAGTAAIYGLGCEKDTTKPYCCKIAQ
jgi:hypothetical protein